MTCRACQHSERLKNLTEEEANEAAGEEQREVKQYIPHTCGLGVKLAEGQSVEEFCDAYQKANW